MTPLVLPSVTLVAIDCVAHALTRRAIENTLGRMTPAETLIFSDRDILSGPGIKWIRAEAGSLTDVAHILWQRVPLFVETSHFLTVQWDGWVLSPERWNPEWLNYDYIGAPWPWHPEGHRVGNGGFSLRSAALGLVLANHRATYQPVGGPEDVLLALTYRQRLEYLGFHWAPERLAQDFSFEHGPPRPTFGFHGCWNWPKVLSEGELAIRQGLANPYVHSTPAWKEFEKCTRPLL